VKNVIRQFPESEESLNWTNSTGSSAPAGTPVRAGLGWGIPTVTIANSTSGIVAVRGEFRLVKGTGVTFAQGDRVTFDGTNTIAWNNASTRPMLGIVTEAADTNATSVSVLLVPDASPRMFTAEFVITSTEAALNSNNGQVDFDTGFGVAPRAYGVRVLTASTRVEKTAFTSSLLTSTDAGKIRVQGVAAGTQLDANDIVMVWALP
jgi:predicted RecA/RadA family phage recombinase